MNGHEGADYEELVLRLIRAQSAEQSRREGLVAASADAEQIAARLMPLRDAAGLRITETRVNALRRDVRLESADGRAWLVVLWMDDPPKSKALSVTVFERPLAFLGRPLGLVVVLNGPSSAGKSSLMAAFADQADTPWACLDEPMFGRFPTRYLAWPETAGPALDGVLAGLAASARVGNQFLVSAAGIAQDRFQSALVGVPTVYVGLDAPLHVLVERQLTQADKFGGLAEESIGIHESWSYNLRIDTATNSPSEATRLLADYLAANDFGSAG